MIEKTTWEKDREYFFTFQIDDVTVPYDIIFEVRNNDFYPYRNLWIFYNEELPVGPIRRDTVELTLADEYGRWSGKGFSLYESAFVIKSARYFPLKGQYTFTFKQGMRGERLQGVHEIGLRIERAAGRR